MTGSADATFVLQQESRASNAAKLYVTGREEWTGTATELLDALGETETAANVLTKWRNEYRLGFLLENHIRYDFSRRSSGRMISLAVATDI